MVPRSAGSATLDKTLKELQEVCTSVKHSLKPVEEAAPVATADVDVVRYVLFHVQRHTVVPQVFPSLSAARKSPLLTYYPENYIILRALVKLKNVPKTLRRENPQFV